MMSLSLAGRSHSGRRLHDPATIVGIRLVCLSGDYSCFFLSLNYLSQIKIIDFTEAMR